MKKTIVISIALISLLSLMSCGKKDETTAASTFTLQGSGS